MEFQEIIKQPLVEGNQNPWAVCSTSITKIIFECDSNDIDDVREFVTDKYIKTNIKAPISKKILTLNLVKKMDEEEFDFAEYVLTYESTVYYN